MKILISGASGFIGRNLIEFISGGRLKHEWDLYFLTSSEKKPSEFAENGNWISINDSTDVIGSIISDVSPDIFINLAWKGIPDYSLHNSIESTNLNANLIYAAYKSGAKRVITTGSCWEYAQSVGSVSEINPLDESNYFKLAKNNVRKYGELIARQFDAEFAWLRLFYVYGRYQNEHSLLPSLILQGHNGVCPTAKNPANSLDFVNAKTVAEVICKLSEVKELDHGIYNIGTGQGTSVVDIVNKVREAFGYKNMERQVESFSLDFRADVSRLHSLGLTGFSSILEDVPELIYQSEFASK